MPKVLVTASPQSASATMARNAMSHAPPLRRCHVATCGAASPDSARANPKIPSDVTWAEGDRGGHGGSGGRAILVWTSAETPREDAAFAIPV